MAPRHEQTAPVVVEQRLDATIDRVWQAITDPEQMRRWFFENIAEFRAEEGFETAFNVHSGGRDFLHLWRVTCATPNRRIACDWRYEGFEGDSVVEWDLAPEPGGGVTLKLTHSGLHTFEQDVPEFRRHSCEAGWRYFLGERLTAFLAASPR